MRPILKEGLTIRQRQSSPIVEEVFRQYEERVGEKLDIIRPIIHVFVSVVGSLILKFDKTYKRDIFDKLDMERQGFFDAVFSSNMNSRFYDDKMIPCFLLKDFYDGNLEKIKEGGSGAVILREIDAIFDNPELDSEQSIRDFCNSNGIPYIDGGDFFIESVNDAVNRDLDCSMIQASDEEIAAINSEVLRDIFRDSIDAVIYHLRNEYKMNENSAEEKPESLDERWLSAIAKKKNVEFSVDI